MPIGSGEVFMVGTVMVFSIPIYAMWSNHQRKMAEIKARMGSIPTALSEEVRSQLAALRQEIAALRDTTTKFDMSFDAAVSRLEQRVDRLEEEQAAYPVTPSSASTDRVVLSQKG